jgi:hypothetical protein
MGRVVAKSDPCSKPAMAQQRRLQIAHAWRGARSGRSVPFATVWPRPSQSAFGTKAKKSGGRLGPVAEADARDIYCHVTYCVTLRVLPPAATPLTPEQPSPRLCLLCGECLRLSACLMSVKCVLSYGDYSTMQFIAQYVTEQANDWRTNALTLFLCLGIAASYIPQVRTFLETRSHL